MTDKTNVDLKKTEADIAKLMAETMKLHAESVKLQAETQKLSREARFSPLIALAAFITAGIAAAKFLMH